MIRAMKKLLTTSALSILLVSLAGGVFGQVVETIEYSNGDVYVGEHTDDKRHGQGTYTFANERVANGIWRNDELESTNSSSPTVNRGDTIADGLKNLSDLHQQGILTDEEFNAAKRRLLGL